MLDDGEVRAVVAHELGHIAHFDFVIMTVAQSVPLVLYVFYVWTRDRARDGAGALAVSVGAYLTYLASQYVVLLLSRVREFFADEGAGLLTNDPNALASALVKISYGLAPRADLFERDEVSKPAKGETKEQKKERAKRLKEVNSRAHGNATFATLGICNLDSSSGFAISASDASGQFSPARLQSVAQWDLKNPWAKVYEWQSTHPLTARRIEALSRVAQKLNQKPSIVITPDERRYNAPFALELLVASAPLLLGIAGYALGYFVLGLAGATSWSPALCGYGLGTILNMLYAYPNLGAPAPRSIAGIVGEELEASGVNATPVALRGEIIGRGVPGLFWSKNLVLRDASGHITLQYRQPLGVLELLFGWLKAAKYKGRAVRVFGWYRRAPVPYVEISHVEMEDGDRSDGIACHYRAGHLALAAILALVGAVATFTGTDILSALWSALVWVFNIWAHR